MKRLTSEQFEILPPVVRRKYFSSLERLRLANNTSVNSHREFPSRKRTARSQTGRPKVHTVGRSGPRRLTKSSSLRQDSISQADAQWFLNLPEKVKRGQFTEEERTILMPKCATLISDAADDAYYKRRQQSVPDSSTLPSLRSSLESVEDKPDMRSAELDADLDDPLQWLEDDDDDDEFNLQTRLENYRARIAAHDILLNPPVKKHVQGRSLHQATYSLPRSLEPSIVDLQSRQGSVSSSINQPNKMLLACERASSVSTTTSATYYRDPEARLKLRVYLASPQKFDEAVEFGFPSTDNISDIIPKKESPKKKDRQLSRLNTELSHSDMQTFLNDDDDDASLFFDDEQSDDEETSSPTDTDVPLTPSEATEYPPFRSLQHLPYSTHSTCPMAAGSRSRLFQSHACAPPARPGREMTLRITLTRPDLDDRAKTGDTSVKQPFIDPLALSEVTSTSTGSYGSGSRPGSGLYTCSGGDSYSRDGHRGRGSGLVGRFWKKVSFKHA
ncbi:MAG: hypothetical protein M1816_005370 [Peltula sp. TS41687]|nr:MAG: hypothetical protein M1816_005370 [Peltula sp. TS41687]